jgi:inhibitor of cysteine peptidase
MFRLPTISILLSIVIILLPAACSSSARIQVKLSEKDAIRRVKIYIGDTLEVILKGNPTTGYSWEVDYVDSTILRQVGKTEFKADRKARGSGGIITMRFEALTTGQTLLRLIYHRPFEKGIPPIQTREVAVVVKEK